MRLAAAGEPQASAALELSENEHATVLALEGEMSIGEVERRTGMSRSAFYRALASLRRKVDARTRFLLG